ncbi:SS18-like protein 2 isoform X1 [Dama dama]|uniref:SS18-like protein 2 isoform X1 n=1 Tax=Dama dama TaxID=30532 RepID=UPI002A362A82|nr:SS18-like protein 2 isoform X1 [Dama dama]
MKYYLKGFDPNIDWASLGRAFQLSSRLPVLTRVSLRSKAQRKKRSMCEILPQQKPTPVFSLALQGGRTQSTSRVYPGPCCGLSAPGAAGPLRSRCEGICPA